MDELDRRNIIISDLQTELAQTQAALKQLQSLLKDK
jgi:hypothetical protein